MMRALTPVVFLMCLIFGMVTLLAVPATATEIIFTSTCEDCSINLLYVPGTSEEISLGDSSYINIGFRHVISSEYEPGGGSYEIIESSFDIYAEVFGLGAGTVVLSGEGNLTRQCFFTCTVDGDVRITWAHPVLLTNLGLPSNYRGGSGYIVQNDDPYQEYADLYLAPEVPEPGTLFATLSSLAMLGLRHMWSSHANRV